MLGGYKMSKLIFSLSARLLELLGQSIEKTGVELQSKNVQL